MSHRPCTYDQLNVSESCDLSEHSNTNAQKCQEGGDKNSHTEHRKNISVSYKYSLEDWQYLSGILYLLSHHHRDKLMSVAISQVQKQRYRITLDLEVMEDFDPHQIDWENLFELEGNEKVIDSYVEDMSNPVSW